MNSSAESKLSCLEQSFQEPPLLMRCKETIEELQRQIAHLNRSHEIKQQECIALHGILKEKDKRIEQLQARTINLTLNKQSEQQSIVVQRAAPDSLEIDRLNRHITSLREDIARLQDENRRLSSLSELLLNDKQLLTEFVSSSSRQAREKEMELKQLRHDNKQLEYKSEEYRRSLRELEQLYEREVAQLKGQLDQRRAYTPVIDYLFETTGTRDRSSKSQIKRNHNKAMLSSDYTGVSSQDCKNSRLELRNDRQPNTLLRVGSARVLPRSHSSLQRNVTDLYGIVHNGRS